MLGVIPSSLLPPLPRSQMTLEPLQPADVLAHMAILKELYMPPIHGGFTAGDVQLDGSSRRGSGESARSSKSNKSNCKSKDIPSRPGSRPRGRTLSGGSVDLVPVLTREVGGMAISGVPVSRTIPEEYDDFDDLDAADEKRNNRDFEDYDSEEDDFDDEEEFEEEEPHNDPFEREWAEKWLNGVVRRVGNWLEDEGADPEGAEMEARVAENEAILREATAVLAMMAGTSAAGSLTRHLLFPLAPELTPAFRSVRPALAATATQNPNMSPETGRFLAALATSPVSPMAPVKGLPIKRRGSGSSNGTGKAFSVSPVVSFLSRRQSSQSSGTDGRRRSRSTATGRPAALPVLLHDAPMLDHISVGVQTWGSAILLGREMALRPDNFGLFPPRGGWPHGGSTRVLELGAGTGLLSILCRKLLDLQYTATHPGVTNTGPVSAHDAGLVVATDFHPDVIANMRVCVDLNAPPRLPLPLPGVSGPASVLGSSLGAGVNPLPALPTIEIAKLDWTTFPAYMAARAARAKGVSVDLEALEAEELASIDNIDAAYDLVLASDCVYDPTHAEMLRAVAGWVLRLPGTEGSGDKGGTMHLLSPIRPTFTPELESIDVHFPPLKTYTPLADRIAAANSGGAVAKDLQGEGLGIARGLKLGVRGEGKRSVRHRRGEGRTDEVAGYWWWEVGWG